MYKIILQRLAEFQNVIKNSDITNPQDSTIGTFKVFDEQENELLSLFCVENGGESTDTPNLDKRIMPRAYKLYYTKSSVSTPTKPEAISLYTDELPSFKDRRIHIHIGNYPQDTAGCLLLCKSWNGKTGYANQSRLACELFYDLVKEKGIENFTLEIREIANAI